jgi:hypothetical protein
MCHQLKIQLKPKMKKSELYDVITKQLFLWQPHVASRQKNHNPALGCLCII